MVDEQPQQRLIADGARTMPASSTQASCKPSPTTSRGLSAVWNSIADFRPTRIASGRYSEPQRFVIHSGGASRWTLRHAGRQKIVARRDDVGQLFAVRDAGFVCAGNEAMRAVLGFTDPPADDEDELLRAVPPRLAGVVLDRVPAPGGRGRQWRAH